jgi:SAM-dependent methyltransferase
MRQGAAGLHAPATARNREPILAVLARVLPKDGLVLEIGSGTGEHAAWLAPRLAPLAWQPSDIEADLIASIAAHAADSGAPNLRPPLRLDMTDPAWPDAFAAPPSAIVSINMLHIAPWRAAEGLIAGAGRLLRAGGVLYLYGPFSIGGRHTAPSNAAFDASLRRQDPEWGVRDLDEIAALARRNALDLEERVAMPANNLSLVFRRGAAGERDRIA